ncbi:MAG: LL-diaminopimelate aminotransferase [Alphaproteobacteria bacterium]
MNQDFHRVRRLPPYVFAEVNAMKAEARAAGEDVLDFGMGNPDLPSPPHVVEKLVEAVQNPKTHRYSVSRGITGLRKANAEYYGRRFNVDIDPESETIVTLGSKEGFANLAMAITSPGDVVLVPNPSYPIHAYGFIIAGGALRHMPVGPNVDLRSELERAVRHSVPPPLALVLNFPSNPTAQVVGLNFYKEVVDFCKEHGIYILSDLAYAEVYFDGEPPPSIFEVPGAKDIAVEFSSLSKTYSMPGWRIGFATGNKKLIAALARIKSYLDYGAFTPIQVAATAALNGPQDCIEEMRGIYRRRRDVLVESFSRSGWDIPSPSATMFAWAPIPEPFRELGSLEFSKLLLDKAQVAVSPGIGFGEYGEGYVRVALVENQQRILQAARNIKRFMAESSRIVEDALKQAAAN